MTIEKARELLVEYATDLTDMEILELNRQSKIICEFLFSIIVNDHKGRKRTLTLPDRSAKNE